MGWTELQRRMLVEMGLPHWLVPVEPFASSALTAQAAEASASDAEESLVASRVGAADADRRASARAEAATVPVARVEFASKSLLAVHATIPGATPPLDWDALRAAVATCTACGLCQARSQTVFGTGGREARWLVIGDAPRDKEDAAGEPFVGRCGPLLDNMLAALRLTRADAPAPHQVFVTNALKCRLPDHRNPLPEEFAACEGHLVRQIELLRPSVIVVVGRFAAQNLLRTSEPVGRLRARAHAFHGVPLVVTHDPAVLLRHPELKPRAWEDLCLAAELADGAGIAAAAGTGAPAR